MKLFLIRHGESENNVKKVFTGQMDIPLTDAGRAQAEAIRPLLERFPFDKVYSSDLMRAAETQQLALPDFEGERLALLREVDVGFLSGQDFQEARAKYGPITRDYTPFGGENVEMLWERARTFLNMMADLPCEYAAAFAHGGLITGLLEVILGGRVDREVVASGNCAIHVFEYKNGKWYLRAWNYMGEI